jgi:hypothetical protein
MDSPKQLKHLKIYPLHVDAHHQPLALLFVQFHLPAAPDDLTMVFKTTASLMFASDGKPVPSKSFLIN